MKIINNSISSRKLLVISMLGFTFFVLLAIFTSVIYINKAEEEKRLKESTIAWAHSLAQISVGYLSENPKDTKKILQDKLKELVTLDYINYIHIYQKESKDKISYFTGFNKSIYYPPIPDKIDQIETLSSLKYQNDYAELIIEIKQGNKTYGYLYIQSSTKHITDFNKRLVFIFLLLLLLVLSFTLILALLINNKINKPIITILKSIQEIYQSKNYSKRIENLPLVEFDVLAKNINILLTKTEKNIENKTEEHKQILLQNNTLAKKVKTRTDALKESNQELVSTLEQLHQFQGQLVETEKMASLGDMVAGIAHEINTPIGLGVTTSTLMADRLNDIKEAFENKSLKSSQLKSFLTDGKENIDIIYRNLDRAAKLINSFKQVAVDQSNTDTKNFNIKQLIEEVLLTLKTKLDSEHVHLTLDCPENIMIKSKPGPLNQILINLILNSIIHGFENKPDGSITISVIYLSNQLHVTYKDDGIGIDESIKAKIFDPFTTTKRGSGGSGLGLHLVYNLVTQALNGYIDFESNTEEGTTFNIAFPVILMPEQ